MFSRVQSDSFLNLIGQVVHNVCCCFMWCCLHWDTGPHAMLNSFSSAVWIYFSDSGSNVIWEECNDLLKCVYLRGHVLADELQAPPPVAMQLRWVDCRLRWTGWGRSLPASTRPSSRSWRTSSTTTIWRWRRTACCRSSSAAPRLSQAAAPPGSRTPPSWPLKSPGI